MRPEETEIIPIQSENSRSKSGETDKGKQKVITFRTDRILVIRDFSVKGQGGKLRTGSKVMYVSVELRKRIMSRPRKRER